MIDIKQKFNDIIANKKTMEIVAGLFVIIATIGVITAVLSYENFLNNQKKTIILSAKSPELGSWNKPEIVLVKGEPVVIKIRNIDTVTHGFAIPELGIGTDHLIEIKAGHVERVEFTPTKEGTYFYMCTIWCSKAHPTMTGKIKVVEK